MSPEDTKTTATITEPGVENDQPGTRRIGMTPFWLSYAQEKYAISSQASWRLTISFRPPRSRKLASELPLVEISPRHPLFTLRVGDESFPLLVSRCEEAARGALVIGGTRKMMLKATHTVMWEAKLKPGSRRTETQINCEFRVSVNPPLPASKSGDLRIEVFSPMLAPEPWCFPYAPESHRGATCLWGAALGVAVSVALPGVDQPEPDAMPHPASSTSVAQTVSKAVRRSRGAYRFSIQLGVARTRSHAQFMHMRHAGQILPLGVPEFPANSPSAGLRDHALEALQRLTDKGAYDIAGIERIYVKSCEAGADTSGAPEFCAGFPHFPLDGARAMLDWDRLFGEEAGARLAVLIARGIATDFTVLAAQGEYGSGINKGAFWERRRGVAGARDARFTDYLGDDFHSIAATARISKGLFGVYERSGDTISLNAAVSACQWLILKQNDDGYYSGDRVCSMTGAVMEGEDTLGGIETITPLVQAYRVTKKEIYMKAAMRVARHLTDSMMTELIACPIYKTRYGLGADTPASVASLVRALAFAHSESETRRTREELEMAGVWLKAWDINEPERYGNLNCDGRHDGQYEIARAALQLLAVLREPVWLEMALRIGAAMPFEGRDSWQALPLFVETMLGLVSITPNCHADPHAYSARVGWTEFQADASSRQYIRVAADEIPDLPVDYLPLVAPVEGRVLLPILAHGPAERVRVHSNGKEPNLRDLVTGEIVCQPAPLHKLPFPSPMRWGCFTIDP